MLYVIDNIIKASFTINDGFRASLNMFSEIAKVCLFCTRLLLWWTSRLQEDDWWRQFPVILLTDVISHLALIQCFHTFCKIYLARLSARSAVEMERQRSEWYGGRHHFHSLSQLILLLSVASSQQTLAAAVHTHCRRLLLLLSPNADTYFTVPRRLEG